MTERITYPTALAAALAAALCLNPAAPVRAQSADTTEAVVNHHLEAFEQGDVDDILSDYAEDAVFMVNGTLLTGPEEMRPVFEAIVAEFNQPDVTFEMTHMQVSGRIAYLVWSAETPANVYELATDTFLVEDGKIVAQTYAGKVTPK